MKLKSILLLAMVCVMTVVNFASAANIYFDDGKTHSINNDTYQNDYIWLDKNTFNDPGTHLELLNGGKTGVFLPFNISTITINGGVLNGSNVAIDTQGDNIVRINGGTIIGDIAANNNSRIFISGGSLGDDLYAYDNGTVEVRGGSIGGIYGVFDSGTIYLYGSNFRVNGQSLNYGDSLRDYVSLSPVYPEYFIGTITGTLQNGSAINNDFGIWASTDADIIVIPEPATLLLLGLGAVMVKKTRAPPSQATGLSNP